MTTRLAAIDLNLLVALDALLAEGNVTRAGRRVGLSQPAMSHALARLRDLLGDPVLVRGPDGMRPTALAAELAPQVRELCEQAERVLLERAPFAPATAERRFVVAASDYVGVVLLPALTRGVLAAAPGVQLRIRSLPGRLPVEELAAGEVDLVIGTFAGSAEAVESEPLLRERFVCLLSEECARTPLDLDRFTSLGHVLIASPGEGSGPVDEALEALGRSRRVAVYVPHFLVAPALVAGGQLVLTLPERIARLAAGQLQVRAIEPPVELDGFDVRMYWHGRTGRHPAFAWLRDQVRLAARADR